MNRLARQWTARRTALRNFLLRRLRNPTGQTRPAFLVGAVRSGTSMIVSQLARSWQVELYNEDHPAAFDYWRLRDFAVIEDLLAASRAPLTLFKPILDTHRARQLLAGFPEGRLIFALRDFDDVINSARKRFYEDDGSFNPSTRLPPRDPREPVTRWMDTDFAEFSRNPLPAETTDHIRALWRTDLNLNSRIALRWVLTNRLYFDLGLDREDRVRLLRYEDLAADPEPGFRELCGFLGLAFDPEIAAGVFASSIGKEAAPDLAPSVRAACEALMERLARQTPAVRTEAHG